MYGDRGIFIFLCSADHEQGWQPYPVDPYFAICDDHTYIHTYIHNITSRSSTQVKRESFLPTLSWQGAATLVLQCNEYHNQVQICAGKCANIYSVCVCVFFKLRLHYTRLFPDPRLLLFVLQNIAGYKKDIKCGWMSASMKWRHLSHLQLLSRAVAVIAEMEISPKEEMADPQGMKVFAVERHGLSCRFCVFSCSAWSAIVATRICAEPADCLGSATGVGIWRVSVLQAYVLLSGVLKLDERTLVHRVNQLTWTLLPLHAPAETVQYASRTVEDGGRERLWSGCEPKPVSADQVAI